MSHLGIVNITLFCTALGGLGTVGGQVLADGKVTLADARYVPQLLAVGKKFVGVNYPEAVKEALDIDDDQEREAIAKVFDDTFDLPAGLDSTEAVVEQGADFVLIALQTISQFVHHEHVDAQQVVAALQAKGVPVKGLAKAA
jgi:hypothetical protein